MQFKYLENFMTTAACRSFAAAAEKLYLSTPALVKQINALENEIGFALFVRSNQGIALTDSGKFFYDHAKEILDRLDALIQESQALYSDKPKKLTIGAYGSDIYVMIPLFTRFMEKTDPTVTIESLPVKMDEIDAKLIAHEIDLCFLYGYDKNKHDQKRTAYREILKDDPLCVIPKQLDFSAYEKITLDDLANQDLLIVHLGNDLFHDAVRREITEKKLPIRMIPVEEGIVDGQLKRRMQPLIYIASRLNMDYSDQSDSVPFFFHDQKIPIGLICRKEDLFFFQTLLPEIKKTFSRYLAKQAEK